jgi:murein DD-endopeptidase MepM/ murein hydrolase activator NlpD
LEDREVNRKVIVALAILVWIGASAVPVQAQSGGPTAQTPAPQTAVHIVQRGETLFSIARQYGLTVDGLAHTNGIPDPRQIYVGQRLVISGGRGAVDATMTVPYVVQAGDTLASIARRYLTTWQTLTQANGLLSPHAIYAGQIIQVPVLNTPAGEEEAPRPSIIGGVAYIVRPDDTLLRIALRYGVSPWTLAAASRVANPALIHPGQELGIPGEGAGLLPEPFAAVEVRPLPVAQGTTMVITVHTTEPVTLEGGLFGQEVRFAEARGIYYGLVGVHVFTEPGLYELELKAVDGRGRHTTITTGVIAEGGRFGYERIDLPASRTSLLDPAVIAADRERLDALRRTFTPKRHWTMPFQRPCVGTISSYYGTHRAYNGGPYTSYHSGVDFRAPGGTPVHAPAGGIVILADPLAQWGNAVVIDHGWGVLTGYAHLSTIEVQVGQQVSQGDLIGKVGSTGLSTGAHLHWEMWVGGNSVNGLQWLEESYPWTEPEWLAIGG